jgi:hypothetical protein
MSTCGFSMAWVGRCKNPAEPGKRCQQHAGKVCVSCGQPATHECDETGQFVCGEPLCDDCTHTIFPDGSNGGIGFNAQSLPDGMRRHCKRSEQRFSSWLTREYEKGEESCPK